MHSLARCVPSGLLLHWTPFLFTIGFSNTLLSEKYQQPQICRWYRSNGRKMRRTKDPLDEGEKRVQKLTWNSTRRKTKIMTSGSITSWQIEGEKVETVTNFVFLGSWITVDRDSSHEIKRCLLLGRKATTNLDSILKSRDITLLTRMCIVKTLIFPVVMYGCESWTTKEDECQRIDAVELWCWRRLLRVPLGLQGDPTSPS